SFSAPAPTLIYPLSLHDALPIFAAGKGMTVQEMAAGYAVLGAQRALRIIGIFARLCLVSGKPGYVALIPRVWAQLMRNLAHPARSEEHTSELQSREKLVCRLLLE